MNTPIVDFVEKYADAELSRMHMPGHKGKSFLGCESFDITEIDGADVLYSPNGIIEQSENNASELFNTAHTYYSTQGSSLCINAMLAIIAMDKPLQKTHILAARNVHKAFVHAAALLDLDVNWVYPQSFSHICSADITADDIEKAIAESDKAFDAVYITSPDYLGQTLDIRKISDVCRKHGIPLLVDNAHGAYLAFCESNEHPINLGADMCCDSAHKTLPVLTGGAYLHISKKSAHYCKNARRALSLFASTSPSYLILQSLDLCNNYLENHFRAQLAECIAKIDRLKDKIKSCNSYVLDGESLKIVIDAKKSGYTGTQLGDLLRHSGIECEFCDDDFLVLMTSPQNNDNDYAKVYNAFSQLKPKAAIENNILPHNLPHKCELSIRQAVFSKHETADVENACGEICAMPLVSCPPAVPIVISGEVITHNDIELLKKYRIDKIEIVSKG